MSADLKTSFPPRIHVLLRNRLDQALIIRRGPAKYTGFFSFNFKSRAVSEGQWLKGRIYERRSDISPDGKHLIYFASNGYFNSKKSLGSWTAISKYPYLRAIDLWQKGDCWNGGGIFFDDRSYLLNQLYDHKQIRLSGKFQITKGKLRNIPDFGSSECPGVYFPKLLREGWLYLKSAGNSDHFFEKTFGNKWKILKHCTVNSYKDKKQGTGIYYDINTLYNPDGETMLELVTDFMEIRGKTLFFAREGKIYYASLKSSKIGTERLVVDMADYTFKRIPAPYG